MAVEHVHRAFVIDDLAIPVSVWRWICDDCGTRETFFDEPLPYGLSDRGAQERGWRITWLDDDDDACVCPTCATLRDSRVRAALSPKDQAKR